MRKISLAVLGLFIATLLIAGCGRGDYSYVYKTFDKSTNYAGGNYTNYLVCYEPVQDNFRGLLEDNVVSQLKSKGINAVAGYKFFGNIKGRINKAQAEQMVKTAGFDGVLIIGEKDNFNGEQMYDQLTGIANQTNDYARKEYQAAYAKVYSVELVQAVWKTDVVLTQQVDSNNIAHEMANATANEVVNWLNNDDLIGNKYNMLPQQAIKMLSWPNSKISITKEATRGLPNTYELQADSFDGKFLIEGMYPTSDAKYILLKYSTKMSAGRLNIVITDTVGHPIYVLGNNLAGDVSINFQENPGFKIYIVGQKAQDVTVSLSFSK